MACSTRPANVVGGRGDVGGNVVGGGVLQSTSDVDFGGRTVKLSAHVRHDKSKDILESFMVMTKS